ncbi:MAG: hypothetical protein ACR2OM_03185 [Aestuariivirgaceae bacterium]
MAGFRWTAAITVVSVLALSACTGSQRHGPSAQSNTGQVLSTTETAPADLQLTCSSAAASQFGLPPDKVLPLSSSKLPDGAYQVRLTSDGRNFLCTIDDNANIVSLIPG